MLLSEYYDIEAIIITIIMTYTNIKINIKININTKKCTDIYTFIITRKGLTKNIELTTRNQNVITKNKEEITKKM